MHQNLYTGRMATKNHIIHPSRLPIDHPDYVPSKKSGGRPRKLVNRAVGLNLSISAEHEAFIMQVKQRYGLATKQDVVRLILDAFIAEADEAGL